MEEVLQKIMKKGAKNRNAREQRKAIEGCRTFVQTGVYNKARERMEKSEQKQVFILDDYWGSAFHRERSRKDNYILEELIDKFRITDGKCLIITTREYIVQQELFLNLELQDIGGGGKLFCT